MLANIVGENHMLARFAIPTNMLANISANVLCFQCLFQCIFECLSEVCHSNDKKTNRNKKYSFF